MRDDLLTYYERELTYLRRSASQFADKYPKIAGRLLLERGKCEDPHVERMIEACALMAARIHLKLDDEFPQITESLLQVLYPHYLAPVPAMSIAQFDVDSDQGKLTSGYTIDARRALFSKPSQQTRCRFRTCYPVTLWPIAVVAARLDGGVVDAGGRQAPAAVTVTLRAHRDVTFPELEIDSLRFYLGGEDRFAHQLYEALAGHCYRVELRSADRTASRGPVTLPNGALREVGFSASEGLLPYSPRSFLGYRLLQEYFHFPQKFLFLDVLYLDRIRLARFEGDVQLVFFLDAAPRLDQPLQPEHMRLGCTPVVNLFEKVAEPIRLDHAHTEYRVVADVRHQATTEIYSIDSVTSLTAGTNATTEYQPFYSFKHAAARREQRTFWHSSRRASEKKDDAGTELYLSLVDLDFKPTTPATDILTIHVTCSNRDLPGRLPFGDPEGDFELEGAAPVRQVTCLTKPTKTRRAPQRHGLQWRLVSHLSLNYLSAVQGGPERNPEVLQEILKLYDFSDEPVVQQQIAGIVAVDSRPVMRRIRSDVGSGFARGIEATLVFDESKFVGSGVYLFSSVLEKFLGLYVSINSFSEMVSASAQRGVMKRWPPRSGQQVLL
jgi:type VI secretion system protein ImpG